MMMRIYQMVRDEDETGNSGTGVVGEVVKFSDGRCVLAWSKDSNALAVSSLVVYSSINDLLKVHGHGGKTRIESIESVRCQACGCTWERAQMREAVIDGKPAAWCIQCDYENVPVQPHPMLDCKPGKPTERPVRL
ncbi:MAG: hypothetical protein E6Q97_10785 [Desulfurellales bacterium]|nr:MAG: hypothetical protein E6Q97_10785 [Desulfurellales bacterium]